MRTATATTTATVITTTAGNGNGAMLPGDTHALVPTR